MFLSLYDILQQSSSIDEITIYFDLKFSIYVFDQLN